MYIVSLNCTQFSICFFKYSTKNLTDDVNLNSPIGLSQLTIKITSFAYLSNKYFIPSTISVKQSSSKNETSIIFSFGFSSSTYPFPPFFGGGGGLLAVFFFSLAIFSASAFSSSIFLRFSSLSSMSLCSFCIFFSKDPGSFEIFKCTLRTSLFPSMSISFKGFFLSNYSKYSTSGSFFLFEIVQSALLYSSFSSNPSKNDCTS